MNDSDTAAYNTAPNPAGREASRRMTQARTIRLFAERFSLLIDSGVSIVRSLLILEHDSAGEDWRQELRGVREEIEQGASLSGAMRKRPKLFPPMLVTMIRAGEIAGNLDQTLRWYAGLLHPEQQFLESLHNAPHDSSEGANPELVTPNLAALELTVWCARMQALLQAGVPILQALEVSIASPVRDPLREAVLMMRESMREGVTMASAIGEFPDLFPDSVRDLIGLGEQFGTLDKMLGCLIGYLQLNPALPTGRSAPAALEIIGDPGRSESPDQPGDATAPFRRGIAEEILKQALEEGAAGILIQPEMENYQVRYRLEDGLRTVQRLTPEEGRAAITRWKLMAGMSLAGGNRSQAGRIPVQFEGRQFDLRVDSFPYVDGEGLSIRLLDRSEEAPIGLEELGMTPDQRAICLQLLHRPYGILVTASPTSGDSARTLRAMIHELRLEGILEEASIVLIEDSAGSRLSGVTHSEMDEDLELPEILRGLQQQDPDVIAISQLGNGAAQSLEAIVDLALSGRLVIAGVGGSNAASALEMIERLAPSRATGVLVGAVAWRSSPDAPAFEVLPASARTGIRG